jgi:protein SCO1/2
MPLNANSRIWWFLVPLGALLGLSTAIWFRTASPATINIDFTQLTNVRGQPGNSAPFAGRYLLVSFGYTSCPDVCPLTLAAIHSALRDLGSESRELVPVFISIDPVRDTPNRVGDYVRAFDPRIHGFTGSTVAIAAVASAFRVEYQTQPIAADGSYTVDHTALLFLLDPKGRVVARIPENMPQHDLSLRIALEFNSARHRSTS